MEQKFYICKHCGNIIAKVKDTGVPVICCGEPMSEIVPGTTDASVEKHVPVWTVENGIVHVKVGSLEHPMLPEHYIEWVSLLPAIHVIQFSMLVLRYHARNNHAFHRLWRLQ